MIAYYLGRNPDEESEILIFFSFPNEDRTEEMGLGYMESPSGPRTRPQSIDTSTVVCVCVCHSIHIETSRKVRDVDGEMIIQQFPPSLLFSPLLLLMPIRE